MKIYFLIAWKQMKYKIMILILILTMALVFCQAIVLYVENKFENDGFQIPVAILNEDTTDEMETLLHFIMSHNEITSQFEIQLIDKQKEGL